MVRMVTISIWWLVMMFVSRVKEITEILKYILEYQDDAQECQDSFGWSALCF